jgi:hypothetical protein
MADGRVTPDPAGLPADRYGALPTPLQRRRRLRIAVVAAVLLAVLTLVWVGRAVLAVPVRTQDVGFAVVDDSAVDVTFIVGATPGSVVQCRLRALSPSFAEVGVRDVVIGPMAHASVQVTTRVATSERATMGQVQRCERVDGP